MKTKSIFTCLAILLACGCFAQVYVTKVATLYPNTDSAFVIEDSLIITVNQEAGAVQIMVDNFPNSAAMVTDTAILDFDPHTPTLTMRDGKCTYLILSTEKGKNGATYYLDGPIHYVNIRENCIFIAFSKAKDVPIMLTGF